MFGIKDFVNPYEFIKKLNDKISNLFDGKYSSLTEIPTEFPPEDHTHKLVSELNDGFVSVEMLNKLLNNISKEDRRTVISYVFNSLTNLLNIQRPQVIWDSNTPSITPIVASDFQELLFCKYQYKCHNVRFDATTNDVVQVPVYLYTNNIIDLTNENCLGNGDNRVLRLGLKIDFSDEQNRNNIARSCDIYTTCAGRTGERLALTPIYIPITLYFDVNPMSRFSLVLDSTLILGESVMQNDILVKSLFYAYDYKVGSGYTYQISLPNIFVNKSYKLVDGGYSIVQPYSVESGISSELLNIDGIDTSFSLEPHYPSAYIERRRITISATLVVHKKVGANDDILKILPNAEFIVHNIS